MSRTPAGSLQWQPSILGFDAPGDHRPVSLRALERRELSEGAWLDTAAALIPGPDALFEQVLRAAPWSSYERPMYDRMVVEPRLTAHQWRGPPDALRCLGVLLSEHYGLDLCAISANLYRSGADSVAWHGDRIRHRGGRTVVAVLSLGSARRFLLRPVGGGTPSVRLLPASGDLLVMGGTCQRTWQHCVPKCVSAGPRISIMFREPHVTTT